MPLLPPLPDVPPLLDLPPLAENANLDWAARNTDSLHEYYDSKTGKGIGVGHFGWSATFAIEFILSRA